MEQERRDTTYAPVIGLEIHVELKTKTKMFCYSLNDPNEKHPNINICPICMGHPGTLPIINEEAVKKVITVGLALYGDIPEFSQFDRKNYFYPDLPKGYQISQYKYPLVVGGFLDLPSLNQDKKDNQILNSQFPIPKQLDEARGSELIEGQIPNSSGPNMRRIRIRRIHLEEDTGRLIHDGEPKSSLVDFNRAGVPLMELVTEPDFSSGEEVKRFGAELQRIIRYVEASDADMEKGEMRVEVNISLRQIRNPKSEILNKSQNSKDENELGTKVEIKNINSFKFAADAIKYETKRQTEILEAGKKIKQETRGWDEHRGVTFPQRSKEEAHDYRYFPEPDLPPLKVSREYVGALRAKLPELPQAKRSRFIKEYGLDGEVVEILVRDHDFANYFEQMVSELKEYGNTTKEKAKKDLVKSAAALYTGDFLRILNKASAKVTDIRITAENVAELVLYIVGDKISNLAAKVVLKEMFGSGEDPSDIIDRLGLWQMSDVNDLESIVSHIVEENPVAVSDYRSGKVQILQFLVGQVMKESRGKANPKIIQDIIKKLLE